MEAISQSNKFQQNIFKICPITQSPEKFLCLNQECIQTVREKTLIQCYECINKQHIMGKNKTIRHHDDIIELDKFMKQIQEKCNKKEAFLNQLILTCNDFQKEKIQHIELTQTAEIAQSLRERIENDVQKLTSTVGQEIIKLKGYAIYSQNKHQELIKCYFENEQLYTDVIKQQFKQMVEKIQVYVLSFDCDLKLQVQRLEERTKCLQATLKDNKRNVNLQTTILLIIISFIISCFYNYYNLEKSIINETNSRIDHITSQLKLLLQPLDKQIQSLKMETEILNQSIIQVNIQISSINEVANMTSANFDKLKLRFDSFKNSQTNNVNEIKVQIQNLNLTYSNYITNQLSQFQLQIERSFLNKEIQIQDLIKNSRITKLEKIIEEQIPEELKYNQKQRLMIENNDLIGKIHKNLNLNRLVNFTLLFDHFFNKYISLSTLDKIYKKVTQNNQDQLICIGGLRTDNPKEFLLAACDFATEVFQPTHDHMTARKSQNGEIFWYLVDYRSFGFSPKKQILLITCDDESPDDENRFSYWFSVRGRIGGRRIGRQTRLENTEEYKIQIYALS